MIRIFYLFLLFFESNVIAQQSSNINFFEKTEFDKVLISYHQIEDKIYSSPPSSLFSETEEKEIKEGYNDKK